MKRNKTIYKIGMALMLSTALSCTDQLIEMNQNPNGSDPSAANPNMVLSTVLTEAGRAFVGLGYQDVAGVMQYTQKDGWIGGHNSYEWNGSNDWSGYYGILRNNKFVYDKAVALEQPLQQGVSLVMKSLLFGLITDLWGDAPYSKALQGEKGGPEFVFPAFDPQQQIYEGILADLEQANTLLSAGSFNSTLGTYDVYFQGNVLKWRKFANSLALRYYMRLAEKLPAVAKAGVEKIVADPTKYPIILDAADDVTLGFPGNSNADSWPSNATYDTDSTNYRRIKMCQTFVDALLERNDPRIGAWANKVKIFLQVKATLPAGTDRIADTVVNGVARKVRYMSPDKLVPSGTPVSSINQHPDYVGLPIKLSIPYTYNQFGAGVQSARNPHVSWVNSEFANAKSGIKARILTAAEVNFILAEASSVYKWNAGAAETHYYKGIEASFKAWKVSNYAEYIKQPLVVFDGTQKQIITQKWISSWSMATEAWMDWRRTGYPVLEGAGRADVLPVRFYYPLAERDQNADNIGQANATLEKTQFSALGDDGAANSIWSKPWVIQGTKKPW
ncbi:SusD/RagB family nutrient-binding outer membrane lipoprotein [Ravibacter arvi]